MGVRAQRTRIPRRALSRYAAPVPTSETSLTTSPAETRRALARAQETRERVIGALQEHFAHDALDVDEFERRVTLAHTSESAADIGALLDDLPALAEAPGPAPKAALVPMGEVRPTQTLHALMSTTERRGPWVVPRHLRVRGLVVMGSVEIKMRLPGETERDAHRRLKQERRDRKALPPAR